MGFGVKNGKNLNEVVQKIEQDSAAKGMPQVKGNRAVAVSSPDQNVSIWDFYNLISFSCSEFQSKYIDSDMGRSCKKFASLYLLFDWCKMPTKQQCG